MLLCIINVHFKYFFIFHNGKLWLLRHFMLVYMFFLFPCAHCMFFMKFYFIYIRISFVFSLPGSLWYRFHISWKTVFYAKMMR